MEKIILDSYNRMILDEAWNILDNIIEQARFKDQEVPQDLKKIVEWLGQVVDKQNEYIDFK